jgi:polyphosphate kinase
LQAELDDPGLLCNREISHLRFFARVLEEAHDASVPLLERVKFLSILASLMSQFFMIRVAGLRQQVAAGVIELSPDGLTPKEQLAAIRPMVMDLMTASRTCLREILVALAEAGLHVVDHQELTGEQKASADSYFEREIFPVLTPLAYDPARPFPFISNMSLNLAVVLRDEDGAERFARVKVPTTLPRLIPIFGPGGSETAHEKKDVYLVWLEQVIAAHLTDLFPGLEPVETHLFRVTRDAEVTIQESEAHDLLETVEDFVRRRRFGTVVRLVVDSSMPDHIRSILARNLEIDPESVYSVELPLATSNLGDLYNYDRPDLKDPPFVPRIPRGLESVKGPKLFSAIRAQDFLLHHPFESFEPVVDFLETAACDPQVLAIKWTLYRVGQDAPIVAALLNAARNGKEVAVLVELKARFDEKSNIEWAKALEHEGAHVTYGLIGLKTHCNVGLVVRREGAAIRRYVHLSTGNYNAITTKQYTDLALFTARDDFGEDASDLFNYLTGYSDYGEHRKLIVAPTTMRERLEALIQREIGHAKRGEEARLILKVNALIEKDMIRLLYEASQAGVRIDLLVRGICCARPGMPGVSDNLTVRSIIGRFLEHSRIYYFRNGGKEECYLGSADLSAGSLHKRVEVLFPVEDPQLLRRIRDEILEIYLNDNVKARIMNPGCTYQRVAPLAGVSALNAQEWFLAHSSTTADR